MAKLDEGHHPHSAFNHGRLRRTIYTMANDVRARVAGNPALRRHVTVAAKGLGAGFGYATLVEPRWVEWTKIDVEVDGLPEAWDGYRVVHLTDVHSNVVAGWKFLERMIDRINALDADLVAATGDFVTHNARRMRPVIDTLGKLRAADGVFATRGNHDYGTPLDAMRDWCREAGIRLLENEHVVVPPSRHRITCAPSRIAAGDVPQGIVVAGTGDLWMGTADPGRALAGAPNSPLSLLLAHNPRTAELVRHGSPVTLQLSGHTHGGQFRPFHRTSRFLTDGSAKFISGWVDLPTHPVYISRGLGTSALYVRWNCRPEVALVTFHRGAGHGEYGRARRS